MKNLTLKFGKHSALALLVSMFMFASCSKKTASISQYDKLAYEQMAAPEEIEEMATIETSINEAEADIRLAAAPMLVSKEINAKTSPVKTKKNALASINKIKEKAPKAIKNITAEQLASVSLLASAAKGKSKAMLEGNLKLAIIFLLLALIAGILPIPFFGIVSLILGILGLLFLILWILSL